MQVILLKDVDKVGLRGDVVDVARGYARNYLLPRRLAEAASPGRLEELRRHEELRARQEARTHDDAREIATRLEGTVLRFDVKAGPTGSLFGSVTATDVADRLWEDQRIRVDRRKVELDPVKRVGRYEVPVEVFTDVSVNVQLEVVPEGGDIAQMEELQAAAEAEEAAAAAEAAEAEAAEAAEAASEAPAAVEAEAVEVVEAAEAAEAAEAEGGVEAAAEAELEAADAPEVDGEPVGADSEPNQ
ncbi:MAG TPA: 50S ribosomal protein L9 [Gaiellaceae bacterium]|nr:50S ribosomal protein L9 [Gaiellaceae bacterium]